MTNLVASYTPAGTRSDDLRDCGFQFTYTGTTGFTVTQLGAWKVSGNTGTWAISLRNAGNTTVLASASISMVGATAGQFNYASCTPFALINGTQYRLVVDIPVGQSFNDTAAITVNNATSPGGVFSVPSVGGGGGSTFGSNNQYGGVDMVFGAAGAANTNRFLFVS
jgi:hypothetical protein